MGTDISGERPLTNPDVIFECYSIGSVVVVISAELLGCIHVCRPSLVLMMVKDNIFQVVISKQIVP